MSINPSDRGRRGPVTFRWITPLRASTLETTPQWVTGHPQNIPIGRPIITIIVIFFSIKLTVYYLEKGIVKFN
ncbi:MAG: hypothetical protein CVU09_00950 [Bacteroidetes bacterium HGW-Bacteroidetes-4]|nr:MAG: hypothetical protein CVU09_00950 [Bacteroidetes bacterium HGW-Bacteroidetes-4]